MAKERLDNDERFSRYFEEYLNEHGWHFNKKLCDFAVSKMYIKDEEGNAIKKNEYTKSRLTDLFDKYNVELKNGITYDAVYIANMCLYDFCDDVIETEQKLVKFVKKYIEDPDGYDGIALTRYYADCIGKGVRINWEEMI